MQIYKDLLEQYKKNSKPIKLGKKINMNFLKEETQIAYQHREKFCINNHHGNAHQNNEITSHLYYNVDFTQEKTLKVDTEIPLGIHPNNPKVKCRKDICTLMIIASLHNRQKAATAQMHNEQTDDWIKKLQYLYTMEYLRKDSLEIFSNANKYGEYYVE